MAFFDNNGKKTQTLTLGRRKLEQAARARVRGNMGGTNNWFDCMEQACESLNTVYKKTPHFIMNKNIRQYKTWDLLRNRYGAEAAALLLIRAYDLTSSLKEAPTVLKDKMKTSTPCHVCHYAGIHNGLALKCKACNGRKILSVTTITCPQCNGDGTGWAYGGTSGLGMCPTCLDSGAGSGRIYVDSLNKPVVCYPTYLLGIRFPFP